eukprot:GHVU01086998.1.p1 GENE.GHVU01086998.1~~GHVU01086998.1.p1  ORF type:complete len:133 (+),score=16.98 GHVU01086998.1:52-450(+)
MPLLLYLSSSRLSSGVPLSLRLSLVVQLILPPRHCDCFPSSIPPSFQHSLVPSLFPSFPPSLPPLPPLPPVHPSLIPSLSASIPPQDRLITNLSRAEEELETVNRQQSMLTEKYNDLQTQHDAVCVWVYRES